jgi:hypothetical protein
MTDDRWVLLLERRSVSLAIPGWHRSQITRVAISFAVARTVGPSRLTSSLIAAGYQGIATLTAATTSPERAHQSGVSRACDLAKTAILDGVDMLFASSAPETVNAVASQAEPLGTPLVCSNIPWEFWYHVATDTWWVPTLPWKSSFTGEDCQSMANEYEAAGNGQWNANISNYSLFEVAHAAFTSVSDPHDKAEAANAIHRVNIQALAGPLDFASGGPAPGVAITPPAGVQWQKGTKYPPELQVVDNTLLPQAKITADLLPTNT